MWLQGLYIYEVLCDVTPYVKAFSKAKPRPYSKEPYDLWAEERKEREEREQKERYERIKRNMLTFSKRYKEMREKQQQESEKQGVDDSA